MTEQEQKEKYQVSITSDPENPPAVNVQVNWEVGGQSPLLRQENTRLLKS